MKILFETLKWRNFLSTGNSETTIDLTKYKSNLIVGVNGSGKSTMMDVLCFCLFGKAYRDINKGDLINTINNKDCFVSCSFSVGKTKYMVERGQKPNVFKIYVDGEHIAQSAQTGDYQEFLEKTILNGWNIRTFKQIVVIGNANYIPFMQQTPAVRRDMVEELLDIKIFTNMSNILKEKMTLTKKELSELDIKITGLNNSIAISERMSNQIEKDNSDEIREKTVSMNDNLKSLTDLKSALQITSDKYDVVFATVDFEKRKTYEDNLKKMDMKEREVETLRNQLIKQNDFFFKNETCPTCTMDIPHDNKSHIMQDNLAEIDKHNIFLEKLEAKYIEIQKKIKDITTVENELKIIEKEKRTIEGSISLIENNISFIKKDIEKLKTKKKENTINLDDVKKQKQELISLSLQKEENTKEKDAQDTIMSFLKDGGIKTQIIKQNIPVLNKLINKYLALMDFFVNFEIDEQFNETIKSRYRDTFKYSSFSEGEKLRIDLSILFAWRALAKMKNSLNSNLLILDEIFESSLDGNGTDELLKIINELDDDTKIYIISHKGDQLFDKFDNVIKFEKHQSFSRIVN